jgi:glucokinase
VTISGGDRPPLLVGDIGGTNVRLAVAAGGGLRDRRAFRGPEDAAALEAALGDYLGGLDAAGRPEAGVLAVAGPVVGDRIRLTNREWEFSVAALGRRLGVELCVVNDLAAVAAGAVTAAALAVDEVQRGVPAPAAPRAFLGVGTGLGVSLAVRCGERWHVVPTEGGHRDLAASSAEEWRLVEALGRRHGHVSAELALSGPGLLELYRVLGESAGLATPAAAPEAIDRLARAGDPLAGCALARFAGWLGAFAGDLALTAGARGGVFLAGGMLPRLGELFDRAEFLRRFHAKGRFREYLEAVPVAMLAEPEIALHGCRELAAGTVGSG